MGSRDLVVLERQLGRWSAGTGALYQKLATGLMRLIREGVLVPGARLPSERRLAEALTLSRTTVVAAYDSLHEAGWVERRAGSSTRVSPTSPVVLAARAAARATALVSSPLLDLLVDEDHGLVDFALGAPLPLASLALDDLELSRAEYAAAMADGHYHPLGLPALREAIAASYTAAGLETDARQVLVTTGAQQAINLCAMAYLQRGDTVLVEDPTYFGALDAFRLAGARLASVPAGPRGADPTLLRTRTVASAPRLIYLSPTFQNPTGGVMPPAARERVAALARETGVPVVEDATLADLAFDGAAPKPLAAYASEAPIITNAGGCGAMLTTYAHLFANDEELAERAAKFTARVRDVSQQLTTTEMRTAPSPMGQSVTYDTSCHLMYGQRSGEASERMLRSVTGKDFVALNGTERCCGAAGVYNLLQPEMSQRVLREKLDHIKETGAGILATGNPGCQMHIGAGACLSGMKLRVCHPIEIVDQAYERAGFYSEP